MLHTENQQHQAEASARLETLIQRLERSDDPQASLLVEHLQTADAMLLGAMPQESVNNLEMARSAAHDLTDHDLRGTIAGELSDLIRSVSLSAEPEQHPHERPAVSEPTRPDLTSFFRGNEISFGIFYPKQFVVAVFWSLETADKAAEALRQAGFAAHDVIAAPGSEVLDHVAELRAQTGLWGQLMREMSRFFDTEANLIDQYVSWAKRGAAFVAVYSREEEDATKATEILKPFAPVAAHWYNASFVRTLPV